MQISWKASMESEERRAYKRKWYAENREYHRVWTQRNRATVKGRAYELYASAKKRCEKSGVLFALTREWIEQRLATGVCEATGARLDLTPATATFHNPLAPSLDRIDYSVGYTPANTRVTSAHFNMARSEFGDAALLELAKLVVQSKVLKI